VDLAPQMVNKMSKKIKPIANNRIIDEKLFAPIITPEQAEQIRQIYENNPFLKNKQSPAELKKLNGKTNSPWIQTYTGKKFYPTDPDIKEITLLDIAHPLSMQCRFSGHVKEFYSVAQHSVLVSFICDKKDALWGLMHDASEAYLVDIPRPIKKSGKFNNYLGFEKVMQEAICESYCLQSEMPESVKMADDMLLATEARDLMSPLHEDWVQICEPLPFKIIPMTQPQAKEAFILRFCQLTGAPPQSFGYNKK
jgi:uncharacterized protein